MHLRSYPSRSDALACRVEGDHGYRFKLQWTDDGSVPTIVLAAPTPSGLAATCASGRWIFDDDETRIGWSRVGGSTLYVRGLRYPYEFRAKSDGEFEIRYGGSVHGLVNTESMPTLWEFFGLGGTRWTLLLLWSATRVLGVSPNRHQTSPRPSEGA